MADDAIQPRLSKQSISCAHCLYPLHEHLLHLMADHVCPFAYFLLARHQGAVCVHMVAHVLDSPSLLCAAHRYKRGHSVCICT